MQPGVYSFLSVCFPVNCPPGTYSSGRSCVPCKEGLYQDEEGQVMCKPCPDGWKTSFLEATSAADCTGTTLCAKWSANILHYTVYYIIMVNILKAKQKSWCWGYVPKRN